MARVAEYQRSVSDAVSWHQDQALNTRILLMHPTGLARMSHTCMLARKAPRFRPTHISPPFESSGHIFAPHTFSPLIISHISYSHVFTPN